MSKYVLTLSPSRGEFIRQNYLSKCRAYVICNSLSHSHHLAMIRIRFVFKINWNAVARTRIRCHRPQSTHHVFNILIAYCCCQFHFENKCLINSFDVQKKAFHLRCRRRRQVCAPRLYTTEDDIFRSQITGAVSPTNYGLSQMCGVQHSVDDRRNTISTMSGSTCCHDVAYDYYLVRLSFGACEKYTHTHHTHTPYTMYPPTDHEQ